MNVESLIAAETLSFDYPSSRDGSPVRRTGQLHSVALDWSSVMIFDPTATNPRERFRHFKVARISNAQTH